jgi:hypothetical protein
MLALRGELLSPVHPAPPSPCCLTLHTRRTECAGRPFDSSQLSSLAASRYTVGTTPLSSTRSSPSSLPGPAGAPPRFGGQAVRHRLSSSLSSTMSAPRSIWYHLEYHEDETSTLRLSSSLPQHGIGAPFASEPRRLLCSLLSVRFKFRPLPFVSVAGGTRDISNSSPGRVSTSRDQRHQGTFFVELRHRFRLVAVTSLKHQHPSQQQNTTVTICSVSLEPSPLTRYTLVRYPYPPLYNFLSPCQFLRIIIHSRKSLVCFCTSAMEEHIHVRSGLFSGRRPCSFVIKISFVPSLQHHRVSRSISSDEDARLNSARSPFH